MSQNTSTAVMQRRVELHDSLEKWRPVPDWDGYECSNMGRVRSFKWPGPGRKFQVVRSREPRILKPETTSRGYQRVVLSEFGKPAWKASVHRLVLMAFDRMPKFGELACHNNGNPTDNRVGNLRWDSPQGNAADKPQHGTHQRGERAGTAKLTAIQVAEINKMKSSGIAGQAVAEFYGVHKNTIYNIWNGKTWAKSDDYPPQN